MNKKAIGKFLLELRNKKNKTQGQVADYLLQEESIIVSTNAISSWERGITIPEIDTLRCLANYFGVSINEILNAEKLPEIDFSEKYKIREPKFEGPNYKEIIDKYYEEKRIADDEAKTKVKIFFKKYIEDKITLSERKEFEFILINFYKVEETEINDILLKIHRESGTFSEKWWEFQKDLYPVFSVDFNDNLICDEWFREEGVEEEFVQYEEWQKDMLLTAMQYVDYQYIDRLTQKQLDAYKEKRGKEYNKEQIIKDTMKFLIEHGACINNEYLAYNECRPVIKKCEDAIFYANNIVFKDLEFRAYSNGTYKFYKAKNTKRNRLLMRYVYVVNEFIKLGYDQEQAIAMICDNIKIPREFLEKYRDTYNNLKISNHLDPIKFLEYKDPYLLQQYNDFHNNEKEILGLIDAYEISTEELKKGNKEYTALESYEIGGRTYKEIKEYAKDVNYELSYKDFCKGRLVDRTHELLKNIDTLSLEQIRSKYFVKEKKDNDRAN